MKNSFIASLALSISALAVGVLAPGCGSDEDPATPPDDPSGVGGGGPSASTGVGGGGPSASTGTMSGQTSSQASGGMGGAAGSSGASSTSGTGGEGGSPPSLPPVCSPSCQSAADCAAGYPQGSSHDEDNWTCSGGACVYTGCKSTAECKVLFPNQNYVCAPSAAGFPPACSPSCQSAADCAAGYPPGSSHDEDNWTCSGGACVYTGCKSTAECKVLFPNQNYTCH